MTRSRFLLAPLVLLWAQQAQAREWPSTAGWDIIELSDSCAMHMGYDGPGETDLGLILGADGRTLLIVSNAGWSTRERQAYPLRYVLNGVAFSGGSSVGTRINGRNGFVTTFEARFAEDFAAGSSLRIYNGDTLVDQLSLSGSAAALAVVRRCLGVVRSQLAAAERERERFAHIPRDPFAAAPASPEAARAEPPAGVGPEAAVLRSGSISDDDYPGSALRAGAQGMVAASYTIGPDGRVTSCAVVGSSGDASLDSTTCMLIQRRFRFRPARDASGNPTSETRTQRVVWTLPPPPPPATESPLGELQPARIWVQLASGTRSDLERQRVRLANRLPALLSRRETYLAADGTSLRLLVGPFLSEADAQALATQLTAARVSASSWSSREGERVLPIALWPRD